MKADFTRDTFAARHHFSRVLQQQGRVTLDADPNEQAAILLHLLRSMARDLIGPYAAPREEGGFQIMGAPHGGLSIGQGRYYVDGIMVENEADCAYDAQPDYPLPADDALLAELTKATGQVLWLYLDVWERVVTPIDAPRIREVALGGPETALRAKVVWQVKSWRTGMTFDQASKSKTPPDCAAPLAMLPQGSGLMAARIDPGDVPDDPCILPPSAQYRGAENQLYRVEIHVGGDAKTATFKWARDNASRLTAWLGTEGDMLQVADSRGFVAGNWVEQSDDVMELQGIPGRLVRIAQVVPGGLLLDPASVAAALPWTEDLVKPRLRRWDQVQKGETLLRAGAVPLLEGSVADPKWLDLEDGGQIAFEAEGYYRSGDYWEIPARVATGDVEWPPGAIEPWDGAPPAVPPKGVRHHYAPLGYLAVVGNKAHIHSCRCEFDPGSSCFQMGSLSMGVQLLRHEAVRQDAEFTLGAPTAAQPAVAAGRNKSPSKRLPK